jgi:hypothetical protein
MITTPKDVRTVRPVAINVAPEAIEPFIDDVEKQDIIPVIGADLYFEIENDRDNPKYRDLLHGVNTPIAVAAKRSICGA